MKKKIFLREKDICILSLIVESYLKEGKPVSSSLISRKSRFSISSATIRNIMVKLEREGYLYQPYTSAGRIPTDQGLRFYVNGLFEKAFIPDKQISLPSENFLMGKGDLTALLSKVSKILSEYSDNLGFVISPRISKININYIRLIQISEGKVIIILVSSSDLILSKIVETEDYFTQDELDRAARHVNENFRGTNLLLVHDYLIKEFPQYKLKFEHTINKLMLFLKSYLLQEEKEDQIFLDGTSKLLEKAELFDIKRLKSLLQKIEEKAKLAKLLSDFISLDRVKVLIGSEIDSPEISDCSLIFSHYGYESQVLGSLGIIGPKRIPYKNIIPLVDCVAKKLSYTISFVQ